MRDKGHTFRAIVVSPSPQKRLALAVGVPALSRENRLKSAFTQQIVTHKAEAMPVLSNVTQENQEKVAPLVLKTA